MSTTPSSPARLRVAHLSPNKPTSFTLNVEAARRKAIAAELELTKLSELTFSGRITAEGRDDWRLSAQLKARAVQPCVVTLAPVASDIETEVSRHYTQHVPAPAGDEVEMGDDETVPLGAFIDIEALMIEELILALPDYPRAPGAGFGAAAAEDASPVETRRPFAGLGKLLGNGESG